MKILPNYYERLRVTPSATFEVIRAAYVDIMRYKAHPDVGGSGDLSAPITEAYGTLKDAKKRAQYDKLRKLQGGFNCDKCEGTGMVSKQKGFLARVTKICDTCNGTGDKGANTSS